jgi:hypothetical protein
LRQRYVFRDGDYRDPDTGAPMPIPPRDGVCTPMIIQDVPAHMALGGIYVSGRAAQRELRQRTGWVPFEPVGDAATMPKRDFDKRDDHWQEWIHSTKSKIAKSANTTVAQFELERKAVKATGSLRERVKRGEKIARKPDTPSMREAREYAAKRAAAKTAI